MESPKLKVETLVPLLKLVADPGKPLPSPSRTATVPGDVTVVPPAHEATTSRCLSPFRSAIATPVGAVPMM
jgi:hypothetical protein